MAGKASAWHRWYASPEGREFLAWCEATSRENAALKVAGIMPAAGYPGPAQPVGFQPTPHTLKAKGSIGA